MKLKPFAEMQHPAGLVRLDWFGGVRINAKDGRNPLLQCLLTPIEKTPDGKLNARLTGQYFAGIGIGYLPALNLGRCFRAGEAQGDSGASSLEQIEFEIDVGDNRLVTEITLKDLFDPTAAEAATRSPVAIRFAEAVAHSKLKRLSVNLVSSTNQNVSDHLRRKTGETRLDVVVHEIELIRFYYVNSSFSCRNIFSGSFSKEKLFVDVFNQIHEKPGYIRGLDAHRFVYRHGYRQSDALTLGRILFSNRALQGARRIHASIAADLVNWQGELFGFPRTYFPFEGVTKIVAQGRRIRGSNNEWSFLIHRILACSGKFPFKALNCCDEIAPGGKPAPPGSPAAFPNRKTIDTGPAHGESSGGEGKSRSDQRPLATSKAIEIEVTHRVFAGFDLSNLKFEKLKDSTYRSEPKVPRELDWLKDGSAGTATEGKTNSAKQQLNGRNVRPSPLTADLSEFAEMVAALAKRHPTWHTEYVLIGEGDSDGHVHSSYFPIIACEKKTNNNRQFSFMDDDQTIRRKYICVEIKVENQYVYLFEAQRRPRISIEGRALPGYKETLPILLLRSQSNEKVHPEDFSSIIDETVTRKTWPDAVQMWNFIRDDTVHGLGAQSVAEIASRVASLVTRNLRMDPVEERS